MEILRYQGEILGLFGAVTLFSILLPVRVILRIKIMKRLGRKRLEMRIGYLIISQPIRRFQSIMKTLNHSLDMVYQKNPGKIVFSWWREAGLGSNSLLFTISWLGICLSGILVYHLSALNLRLSLFLSIILVLSFCFLIYIRAKINRELFKNQLPDTLDRLAGSLQAGFSLSQAIGFIAANLPEPSATEISQVLQQNRIGYTVEEALKNLHQRQPIEEVRLLVEGLSLQRQVGGNMAEMMFEMAELVREKVELKNQVQALTAQGRVSAITLALLLPVSLVLLTLFPGYIDILFNSRVGNLVLITAGCLDLLGTAIIFRLIQVEA